MRALLDTHVWLWYLLADERLSQEHRRCIEDPETELWLSPISVWETHLLIERERISVTEASARWVAHALGALPVKQASLTFAIAQRSRLIRIEHEDPADRLVAATAAEMKLTLLTTDKRLLRCPDITCFS